MLLVYVSTGSTTATVEAAATGVLLTVESFEFLAGGRSILPSTGASPSGFSAKGLADLVVVVVVVVVVVDLGWHFPLTHGP